MGVFTFSFPPQNHNPSNKDLSSLLSYIKTILTKDFITQGFQSQNHNSFKKKTKERSGGEGKGSNTRTKYETKYIFENRTYYQLLQTKRKKKKKTEILGSHFVSGFYYLSKIGKLNSGLLAHKITSSNDQGMQT